MTLVVWSGRDPGLANLGLADLVQDDRGWRALKVETVVTKPIDTMHDRLFKIWDRVSEPIDSGGFCGAEPVEQHLVFESQMGARRGHEERGTTNEHGALVERVVGLIWSCAYATGGTGDVIPPIEVTPAFVRKCLGLKQAASKAQVEAMVRRLVRGLPDKMTSHAADAVAIAIAGERRYTHDLLAVSHFNAKRFRKELARRAAKKKSR